MTSKIKVDNITDQDDNNIINESGDVITVGAAGDTVAVAGNIVKSNALQASDGGNIVNQSGTTITLGASGDTVSLASGASQSGFGRTGTVDWQTTIKTGNFSASDGEGYFVNTTSGSITASLPAGTAGAIVAFKDYLNTFDTNALKVSPNGTDKIGGVNSTATFSTEAQSVTLIFIDSTQGWLDIHDSTTAAKGATFVAATGGNSTVTSGDHKIHVFTGPGTFCVSQLSCAPANNTLQYVVVAGGAGSGNWGGGGAGGYRISADSTPLTATVAPFPVTVGGGGAGKANGGNSIFSTITSTGGGFGGAFGSPGDPGAAGGSGGGGGAQLTPSPGSGGAGNTPPVNPSQGNPGGAGSTDQASFTNGGGGGGAGGTGGGGRGSDTSPRAGGIGRNSHVPEFGSWPQPFYSAGAAFPNPEYFAGGGAGESQNPSADASKTGGNGGGGPSSTSVPAPGTSKSGVANTGGGGGAGGSGGSGIVLIRYKFQ